MEFEEQFKEAIRQSINYLILTDGCPSTTIDELALKIYEVLLRVA